MTIIGGEPSALKDGSESYQEYQLGPEDVIEARRYNAQQEENNIDDATENGLLIRRVEEHPIRPPAFGDSHTYFNQRKRKLAEQAEIRSAVAPKYDQIFSRVVFHINGYTQPSHYELKLMLIERGGKFLHYLSKTQVTHIIASGLTLSKEKEFRNYKVVRPEWVVESVKANRLLPWHRYALIGQGNTGLPIASSDDDDTRAGSLEEVNWSRQVLGRPPVHAGISATSSTNHHHRILNAQSFRAQIIDRFDEGLNREWVRKNLATEKDFIERYYANSRLHHLSMWKLEMKDFVAQLRRAHNKTTAPAPTLERQKGNPRDRVIMHVDFDCFFVSASLLSHPYLQDKPVAVCHTQQQGDFQGSRRDEYLGSNVYRAGMSTNSGGTSQIASCNYLARSFGVRNGMFMGQARELCPGLMTVPYQFDVYRHISRKFYEVVALIADETQAVSVDEALLDVTELVQSKYGGDPLLLAEEIRAKVHEATMCVVSIGIGPSILLARIATTKAKPNGIYSLDVSSFCKLKLGVRDLPGIGHTVEELLANHGIRSVGDIRQTSVERLQGICGDKTATTLYNFSHGIDERVLESDRMRQAFGADIGWGIRFSTQSDADDFVVRLCKEVCQAMVAAERTGCSVTLKVKKRREGQGKPAKFLGHGICDNLTKSTNLPQMTNDSVKISSACIKLLHQMHIDPLDIRSVGIQVQKLNTFEDSGTADIGDMLVNRKPQVNVRLNENRSSFHDLPSASQIDEGVMSELPESIRLELESFYKRQSPEPGSTLPNKCLASSGSRKPSNSGSGSGRRGRPRKLLFPVSSGVTKPSRPKINLLQAFRKVESLDSIMPSQMDSDVWDNLPTNIRRELAREYVKTKPVETRDEKYCSDREEELSADTLNTVSIAAEDCPVSMPAEDVAPMLYGKRDSTQVRQLLREWINSSRDGPYDEDVEEVSDYIEALVKHRNLHDATAMLNSLKIWCYQSNCKRWNDAFSSILNRANASCRKMYSAQLYI